MIHFMSGAQSIRVVQQRVALLPQQERDLRILYTQSHASLAETDEIEAMLVAVVLEIAELESVLPPFGKTA